MYSSPSHAFARRNANSHFFQYLSPDCWIWPIRNLSNILPDSYGPIFRVSPPRIRDAFHKFRVHSNLCWGPCMRLGSDSHRCPRSILWPTISSSLDIVYEDSFFLIYSSSSLYSSWHRYLRYLTPHEERDMKYLKRNDEQPQVPGVHNAKPQMYLW